MPQTEFNKSVENIVISLAKYIGYGFMAVVFIFIASSMWNGDGGIGFSHAFIVLLISVFLFPIYAGWLVISALAGWDKD